VPRPPRKSSIPAFALYGEAPGAPGDPLHVESIRSRSERYDWEIDAHIHRGLHQILWVASGPVTASLSDARERRDGPTAVVIPPGVAHAFAFSPETQGHVLTFDPRAILEGEAPAAGDALPALFAEPRIVSMNADSLAATRISALMLNLAEEYAAPDAPGSPTPLWLARAIVWRLAHHVADRHREGENARGRPLFTRFAVLVEAHHREHWPMRRYAETLGLTLERLNRLTRVETGQAAQHFVHRRLVREACSRLIFVAAPVSKLSFELGFEDPAYFCRFFKRHVGQSPREFRRARFESASS